MPACAGDDPNSGRGSQTEYRHQSKQRIGRNQREILMNKLIVPAVIVAFGMVAAAAWSQTPPANPNVKIYYTTPLENDASRTVRLQSVTIPAKGGNEFHRHPGDQWAAVQ
jgi:hypothetical protein